MPELKIQIRCVPDSNIFCSNSVQSQSSLHIFAVLSKKFFEGEVPDGVGRANGYLPFKNFRRIRISNLFQDLSKRSMDVGQTSFQIQNGSHGAIGLNFWLQVAHQMI